MKENNIEKTIKIIERKIKEAEHYTDITGLCLTLDKELCNAFINILSDYKKVLKENEELNEKILDNAGIYQLGFKDGEESYIKKVKDKIEEEKLPLVIVGGRRNKRTLEYGIKVGRRQVLQELLESEEK